ncbi:MAG: alanine racemase [Treponema sp.]|jgi:alanine racemase|nr:alanine racemase [Treponema sp.]
MRATRALIHLDHLRHNIALVREHTGRRICMPVKAGAYGHGALPAARTALAAGVEYLAVATVPEGEELRKGGIAAPILLLSIPLPEEIPALAAAGLEPLAGDEEYIDALEKAAANPRRADLSGAEKSGLSGRKLPVHLKIDTGMGRIGCGPGEAAALASRIAGSKSLRLAGIATHLAASDSTLESDAAYTEKQLDAFRSAVESVRARGVDPGVVHAANTGGVCFYPGAWFDMVRPGILLYGYAPEDPRGRPALGVQPLMELESRLSFIKEVKKGRTVSYGRTWTAGEDTLLGTIPAGYADGLSRGLGNNWSVLAGGTERPLAGRICMDQCMIDLGRDSDARRWDPVTIFGGRIHAGIMAERLGTIPYEVTCAVSGRVPRVYVD